MARASPRPLRSRSITLDDTEEDILSTVAQEYSDYLGWKIGAAAILRALLHLLHHGVIPRDRVRDEIEREIQSGRRWGGQKPYSKIGKKRREKGGENKA